MITPFLLLSNADGENGVLFDTITIGATHITIIGRNSNDEHRTWMMNLDKHEYEELASLLIEFLKKPIIEGRFSEG